MFFDLMNISSDRDYKKDEIINGKNVKDCSCYRYQAEYGLLKWLIDGIHKSDNLKLH